MDTHTEHVMVALVPTEIYWSTLEYPHLTLVYVGKTIDQPSYVHNELLKLANVIANANPPFYAKVVGTDIFGPEDDLVDVILIEQSPRLLLMRAALEQYNGSEYKEFKPHCTIGPVGSKRNNIPELINFDKIVVAWGDNRMSYQLNG